MSRPISFFAVRCTLLERPVLFGKPFLIGFFYFVSDYGHSILLPFVWLYNFCIGGALIYLHFTELTKFKSLGLSISNLLQITGLQRVYWSGVIECLPWGLKFLGGLQTLLAIPLLFLLLLGLRNRFRLK